MWENCTYSKTMAELVFSKLLYFTILNERKKKKRINKKWKCRTRKWDENKERETIWENWVYVLGIFISLALYIYICIILCNGV